MGSDGRIAEFLLLLYNACSSDSDGRALVYVFRSKGKRIQDGRTRIRRLRINFEGFGCNLDFYSN
jgi:hypothetical protein